MGNEPGKPGGDGGFVSGDVSRLDADMARAMRRGVDWNLKVVIRGDRRTEEYTQTPQIQTAHISWSYKTTNDIVKVEVWDVVDVAIKKKSSANLKLAPESATKGGTPSSPPPEAQNPDFDLDAATVDVTRNTDAIVFTFDPRKRWTWDYITKELPKMLNAKCYILLLENFRDLVGSDASSENQRQVSEYEIRDFVDAHAPFVKHSEASMKNCYGLKSVKIFLDLPFLKQQRDVIQAKLTRNIEDSQRAEEELRLTTESQDYGAYLSWMANRQQATPASPPPQAQPAATPPRPTATPPPQNAPLEKKPAPAPSPISTPPTSPTTQVFKVAPVAQTPPAQPPTASQKATPAGAGYGSQIKDEKKGFFASLFSKISGDDNPNQQPGIPKRPVKSNEEIAAEIKKLSATGGANANIEDFVPEGDNDDWFDSDSSVAKKPPPSPAKSVPAHAKRAPAPTEDDDDDSINPMVAGDQEGIQVDELKAGPRPSSLVATSMEYEQDKALASRVAQAKASQLAKLEAKRQEQHIAEITATSPTTAEATAKAAEAFYKASSGAEESSHGGLDEFFDADEGDSPAPAAPKPAATSLDDVDEEDFLPPSAKVQAKPKAVLFTPEEEDFAPPSAKGKAPVDDDDDDDEPFIPIASSKPKGAAKPQPSISLDALMKDFSATLDKVPSIAPTPDPVPQMSTSPPAAAPVRPSPSSSSADLATSPSMKPTFGAAQPPSDGPKASSSSGNLHRSSSSSSTNSSRGGDSDKSRHDKDKHFSSSSRSRHDKDKDRDRSSRSGSHHSRFSRTSESKSNPAPGKPTADPWDFDSTPTPPVNAGNQRDLDDFFNDAAPAATLPASALAGTQPPASSKPSAPASDDPYMSF